MLCMLDTDTCVAIIRRRGERVLQRLTAYTPGDVALSAVTLGELHYGVHKSRDRTRNAEALARFLMPLVVLAFDDAAAAAYGRIRRLLEASGQPIGAMDALIGAHALALGTVLVTHNTREFQRIEGLRLDDWLADGDGGN